MLEYITDNQKQLGGWSEQPNYPETFTVGIDRQGEGVRRLDAVGVTEEVVGDCCEDLETCEVNLVESEAKIIELTETIAGLAGGQGSATGGLYFEDPGFGDQYVYASDLFFEYDTTTSLANYRGVTQAIEDGSPRISGTVTPAWYAVYEGGFASPINQVSTSVQLGTETNSYSSPDFFLSPDNGGPLSHVEVRINFSPMSYTAVAVVAISFVAS